MIQEITNKQKEYIQQIREMSFYELPGFYGTTKQEADNYIKKYEKQAFEIAWAATKE